MSLLVWLLLPLSVPGALLFGGAMGIRQRQGLRSDESAKQVWRDPASLDSVIRGVIEQELPRAGDRHTRLEMAVDPVVPMIWDREALTHGLRLIVRDALARAEGGRILITAGRHGGRVRVSVIDDGTPVERDVQEALLREPQGIFALLGATMEVEVAPAPGSGTLVVVRLPEPGPLRNTLPSAPAEGLANAPVADSRAAHRPTITSSADAG